MPNRILREGILTSPRIARLGWAEEVFYRRLHSVVDDFGRYFADAGLLRAACYPRQLNKVSDSDIGKWLTVLVEAALVRVYPAKDGERYLELLDFRQQVRAKESKFPHPISECVADAAQVTGEAPADAHLDVSVSVSEDVCVGGAKRAARKCPEDFALDADMRAWAQRECPGVNVDWEFPKFRDHTFKTARTDWPATWRNWVREAFDRLQSRPGSKPATASRHSDSAEETARMLADKDKGTKTMPPELRGVVAQLTGRKAA